MSGTTYHHLPLKVRELIRIATVHGWGWTVAFLSDDESWSYQAFHPNTEELITLVFEVGHGGDHRFRSGTWRQRSRVLKLSNAGHARRFIRREV